jgi:Holliday junction resolvasome RuvABC DNA-binding subunit
VRDDLLSALTNLGYQRASIEKTVDKVLASAEDRSFEPLLRATLKLLMAR